ncbi:cytochrome C, partial [Desulfobacterales bacterium HSG17]|nr:cytochrome C [Desulfobacterales bacterium HSG17]
MVAPKAEALSCEECHARDKSRLAGLGGFYMPGRDTFKEVHVMAWLLVIVSFAGVLFHGIGRIISGNKK